MKPRKLAACLYAASGCLKGQENHELLFTQLLGKPAAFFALQAVLDLAPDLVIIVAASGRFSEKYWSDLTAKSGIPVLLQFLDKREIVRDEEEIGLKAAGRAASSLRRYSPADVVMVPATMPLLGKRTLRDLVKAHRRKGCALTFLAGPEESALSRVFVFSTDAGVGEWRDAGQGKIRGYESLGKRLAGSGLKIAFFGKPHEHELLEIRSPFDLAAAADLLRKVKNGKLVSSGVKVTDPASLWADWDVKIGKGTRVSPFVCLEGESRIGRDCVIHPYSHLKDCRIGDRVVVLPATVMEGSLLESDTQVGPFSRLRPGTVVRRGAHVGNFVEMKKTDFGPGSKAMHLSYLGDSSVGEGVNVGAGTITCNYDGVNKNRTEIGSGVFIGSGTELIAPIKIGRNAYIAAGSTVTRDVSPESLVIARARQVEKPAWVLKKIKGKKKPKKS